MEEINIDKEPIIQEPNIEIFNGDCLKEMKNIKDNSVDLIFCDLPYGQTNCAWDTLIDLEKFWEECMRIKKETTPIIHTTTTKFGVSLIQSAPKKCPFRYDLIWVKSNPVGFLNARKMPLRKHEMIYVFYEKLPFYNLSSHTHKFVKGIVKNRNGSCYHDVKDAPVGKYDPPLPTSIIKEDNKIYENGKDNSAYGKITRYESKARKKGESNYEPPLPTSIIKEEEPIIKYDKVHNSDLYGNIKRDDRKNKKVYDPPLPTSIIKEEEKYIKDTDKEYKTLYGDVNIPKHPDGNGARWEPPLPTSIIKEEPKDVYNYKNRIESGKLQKAEGKWEPPLPDSILEVNSERGKHSTQKPVKLLEWIIKYYSKEGDVIFDATMGSGTTGVACKNLNRNFIGIEMDEKIFKDAEERLK